MKLFQRILIIAILLLPVITGIFFLTGSKQVMPSYANKKLGLVRIEGVIMNSEPIIKQLRSFKMDKSIVGILLRIDSPGGSVAPSQEIYQEILNIRQAGKPVIATMGNIAASGGYYVACPAQYIFADPGTITGSIGVILSAPLYNGLAEKIGVKMRTYKAGRYKDIGNSFRKMSNEEDSLIQSILDDTHSQFIFDIAQARKISYDSVAAISDGRIFTGKQALNVGLVDSLGGYHQALDYLRKITGMPQNVRVVERAEKLSVIRELLVEEIIRIFPRLYTYIKPFSVNYLLFFD